MIEDGTVDEEALAELPSQDGIEAPQPTLEQREANQAIVNEQWDGTVQ